jgi:uncharacterized membrane protein
VNVANSGTTAFSGPVTVALFASTNATLESGTDAQVATLTKNLKLAPGQAKAIKFKIASLPSVADGAYRLIAQSGATGVTAGTAATTNTVNLAAPFVDLAGTFGSLSSTGKLGKKAKLSVNVANNGNTDAKASVPVTIEFTAPGSGTVVATAQTTAKLSLKAGTSKAVKLNLTVPSTLPAGTYNVTTRIDGASLNDANTANNTVASTTSIAVS